MDRNVLAEKVFRFFEEELGLYNFSTDYPYRDSDLNAFKIWLEGVMDEYDS